ncbi:unnamed protein product [Paramecium primaurelia]|uniref:Uncharacterized protein n=1 Tax=Paramecium primaurelia TaxID=5886 RepID=A0A8S1NVB7_PARPR|nr:unnamed protein product [Paramecium primaurelia]
MIQNQEIKEIIQMRKLKSNGNYNQNRDTKKKYITKGPIRINNKHQGFQKLSITNNNGGCIKMIFNAFEEIKQFENQQ